MSVGVAILLLYLHLAPANAVRLQPRESSSTLSLAKNLHILHRGDKWTARILKWPAIRLDTGSDFH